MVRVISTQSPHRTVVCDDDGESHGLTISPSILFKLLFFHLLSLLLKKKKKIKKKRGAVGGGGGGGSGC